MIHTARDYRASYRAGVIGHTGRGGFSHALDTAFVGLPGVTLVAVADPDEAGPRAVLERTGAAQGYGEYHEMLEREDLDAVAVAPSWLDQREAMVVAAAVAIAVGERGGGAQQGGAGEGGDCGGLLQHVGLLFACALANCAGDGVMVVRAARNVCNGVLPA